MMVPKSLSAAMIVVPAGFGDGLGVTDAVEEAAGGDVGRGDVAEGVDDAAGGLASGTEPVPQPATSRQIPAARLLIRQVSVRLTVLRQGSGRFRTIRNRLVTGATGASPPSR